jgi:hypothetical protein
MRLSAFLASLTLVAMLFAGCAGDKDGEGDGAGNSTSGSGSRSTTGSGSATSTKSGTTSSTRSSSTGSGAGGSNQPPTGSLGVSVAGDNATFTMTGEDPEGDALTWDLDFGDGAKANGTTMPATTNHVYAAGNYSANLTISDGTNAVHYAANVSVAVQGAGVAGTPQTFHGEWTASWTFGCYAVGIYPAEDVTHTIMVVDPATNGKTFTATFASDVPNVDDFGVSFQDDGGEMDYIQGPSPITGEVLDGATEIWFYACAGGNHQVDYVTS